MHNRVNVFRATDPAHFKMIKMGRFALSIFSHTQNRLMKKPQSVFRIKFKTPREERVRRGKYILFSVIVDPLYFSTFIDPPILYQENVRNQSELLSHSIQEKVKIFTLEDYL